MTPAIRDLWNLAALGLLTAAALAFAWTGFLGSDDAAYADAARGWLARFPFVGTSHWALRHPLVLPTALSFRLFGVSEASLAAPTVLAFLALVAATYLWLARRLGRDVGLAAAGLMAVTPLFPATASTASVDIVELLFAVLSLMAFDAATRAARPVRHLLLAGALAALAWQSRETTLALLLAYGVLFLFGFGAGFGLARRWYWVMAAGFVAVIGAEYLALWSLTGDPLYRLHVDLRHDVVARPEISAEGFDRAGNVVAGALLNPFLMLLANQEFALLFYVAAPAAVWACFMAREPEVRRLARLLGVAGLMWFLLVATLGSSLYLVPRYVAMTAFAAVVLVALWLLRGMRPAFGLAVAAVLVGTNLLATYVDNKDLFFPERALVRVAAEAGGTVHTDPKTLHRADFLLEAAGVRDRVLDMPPGPGALFLHAPNNAAAGSAGPRRFDPAAYRPQAGWVEVRRIDPGRKLSGVVLQALGLDRYLPAALWRRLDRPNPPAVLYRVP